MRVDRLKIRLRSRGSWLAATVTIALLIGTGGAQSSGGQSQAPAGGQAAQDIPDAPSTVQPPAPKPVKPPEQRENTPPESSSQSSSGQSASGQSADQQEKPAPPPMPPVETLPPGTPITPGPQTGGPRNQINPAEGLYKLYAPVNFVLIPVLVTDSGGRRVDGLVHTNFVVKENGKPQQLTYFTSDPFQLSVAILLDLGMADVAVQKVNQTYSSLVGAFSPYDEYALYTYSSTVSRVTDFSSRPERLQTALNSMKLVRGHTNGPPVLGGPLGPQPPMVNGIPVGTSGPPPVYTPPKEAHVLNDAILQAALDLSKRDRTRRKVIFVISDGRERGSSASYKQVLKVLETYGIQVKAVVLDQGALPVYKQVEKIHHVFNQGYADILPKYTHATGGGDVMTELSRNAIEDAYGQLTSQARNQYTLGYSPKAVAGSSAYRSIEVLVDKKGLKIYAKDGYYSIPSAH